MRACWRQATFSCLMRRIFIRAPAIPIWDPTARTGRTIGGASRRLASPQRKSDAALSKTINRRSFTRMTGRRLWRLFISVIGEVARRACSPFTILPFRASFHPAFLPGLDLPASAYAIDGVEYYGAVGFLKGGLTSANAITTVSPTYAAEIATPEQGMGLDGLIRARRAMVTGIVNGIDIEIWDPARDEALSERYDARQLAKRQANKRAIERRFELERDDGPLFCVVSRLTWQKGMDILADTLDELVGYGARLALLGSGEAWLEHAFAVAAGRHRGRIGMIAAYDEPLSHLLQGGSDADPGAVALRALRTHTTLWTPLWLRAGRRQDGRSRRYHHRCQ